MSFYDVAVVGSGPNGFAASIKMAQAGYRVKMFEDKNTVGGGMRSAQLTSLPGFIHDICSAIHPLGAGSPFFESLPLHQYGLEWKFPPIAAAHPFDNGHAAVLTNSIYESAESLGVDKNNYINIIKPLVDNWDFIKNDILGPLKIPSNPVKLGKFGFYAVKPAEKFINNYFSHEYAKSFFAGMAGHSIMSLDKLITSAIGLVLIILGHRIGWPVSKGGSQKIADALALYFQSLGGSIETNHKINSLNELRDFNIILFDITPKQLLKIMGDKFPACYKKQLEKYTYGPGIFKVDWALNASVPFKNKECTQAGTIHIGGDYKEIIQSEYEISNGIHPEKPFIIFTQQSLFDDTRSPEGHTAWAYCHVPNNSTIDMTERIENQIERFAPGFKDLIINKHIMFPADYERYNSNYIGGDINGGMLNWRQLFTRPAIRLNPYSTPVRGAYICSSSTPPGGGVHGMCGYHAALKALKYLNNKHLK
ncbi:MAG TPA: NAD(P)/FAD-dependent oxidoreductase [Ignavibacteriaceae bacterium]|nr:NAD(P)/FAD-dependent oxidoreductase [Ignavibacteriaceae bacterium]